MKVSSEENEWITTVCRECEECIKKSASDLTSRGNSLIRDVLEADQEVAATSNMYENLRTCSQLEEGVRRVAF